jgi:hypothetical protein
MGRVGIVDPVFQEKNVGSEHQQALLEKNFIPFLQEMRCDLKEMVFPVR